MTSLAHSSVEPPRRTAFQLAVDLTLCAFWAAIAVVTLRQWLREWPQTHQLRGFGIFLVNSTYAYFFVVRKPSADCSKAPFDWMVTALTIVASFLLQMVPGAKPVVSAPWLLRASLALQTLFALVLIASICSLGRSFGLVPAHRGIKVGGMYRFIRHPLYGAQLLFYCAYLPANFTWTGLALLVAIFVGMNLRASAEERLLSKDPEYRSYLQRVRYRFIPGVL